MKFKILMMKLKMAMKTHKKLVLGISIGVFALILLATVLALTMCNRDCDHEWNQATCVLSKTCSLCGETEGEALGHTPNADDGDCTTAVNCSRCNEIVTAAKTAHTGGVATCKSKAHCSVCNKEYGELLAHTWNYDSATEEHDKHCTVCGYVAEEQIGHTHQYADVLSYDDEGHYYAPTCGHTDVKKDYTTHTYLSVVTNPTCTEQGYTTYTCVCGKTYNDDYTSAKGHSFEDTLTSDSGGHWYKSTCGHDVQKDYSAHKCKGVVIDPTCTEQGYTAYSCDCGYGYNGDYVSATGHSVTIWTEGASYLYDEQNCKHAVNYNGFCSTCDAPQQKTEYVEKHAWTYTVKLGFEATCQTDGIKLQTCKNEDCKYHETVKGEITYSDAEAHTWVVNTLQTSSDVTAYHCSTDGCSATKNTVSTSGSSANLSSGTVGSLDEVALNNAVIGFDQGIKDNLSNSGSDVEISAGTLAGNQRDEAITDANLSPEQAALLGDKDIYNFTVTTTENISDLGGTATIRIPYTLSPGEDPDNVIVWYISEGSLTAVPATYADGYVTFSTTHFSYYVATTIAPEQLCEYLNEHDLTNVHTVLPTCTEGGYTVCIRCGKQIEGSETAPLGHEWHTTVISQKSCISNGETKYECATCNFNYTTVVGATGHYYTLKAQTNPSCQNSGYATYGCVYCDSEYTVTLPQLNHNYSTNIVSPTCEERGYTEKTCLSCGDTLYTNYRDAMGHNFDTVWHTDPTGHYHICTVCGKNDEITAHTPGAEATEASAQICTICEYVIVPQLSHTHNLTKVEAHSASCLENGSIAYYTCGCGKWFLDEGAQQLIIDHSTVIVLAMGHTHEALPYVYPTCTTVGYTSGIKCSVCDTILRGHVELPAYGHDYITTEKAPTCTEDGVISKICSACADKLPDETIPKLEHKYIVSGIKAPTCTEDGFTTFACSYCAHTYTGAEKKAYGHNYSSVWYSNENEHWHECTRCAEMADKTAHIPGAEATEYSAQICTVCEFIIEPIKNHTHSVSKAIDEKVPTCDKVGNIPYYICSCGEWYYDEACKNVITNHESVIVAALNHQLVYIPEQSPTCTENGYSAGYYCNRCKTYLSGYKALAALGHDEVVDEAKAPTCTETGLTEGTSCSRCDAVFVAQQIIDALGHTEVVDEAKAPTCTETGLTEGKHCSVCEEVLVAQTVVDALGHTEVIDSAVPATCITTGLTEGKHCSVCNTVLVKQTVIDALGHTEGQVVKENNVDPDCVNAGSYDSVVYCTVCSEELERETITVDALGHTEVIDAAKAATCTETGLTEGKHCSVCNEVLVEQNPVAALGHKDENNDYTCDTCNTDLCTNHTETVIPAVAPTCTESGLSEGKKCSICGDILAAQTVIDALGHTEVVDKAKAPTCTETGLTEGKHCSVCNTILVKQTVIDALGHTEGQVVKENNVDPDCVNAGSYDNVVYCTVCHAEVSRKTITVDALGHDMVTDPAKDPTCTETGLTEGKHCSRCDYKVEQNTIPALGHTEGEAVKKNEVAADCVNSGSYDNVVYCTVCGEEVSRETITVSALGHKKVVDEAIDPTCTTPGLTEGEHCSVCNKVFVMQKTISALGHKYVDGKCENCGEKDPNYVPVKNRIEVIKTTDGKAEVTVTINVKNVDFAGIQLNIYYEGYEFIDISYSEFAQINNENSTIKFVRSSGFNENGDIELLSIQFVVNKGFTPNLTIEVVEILSFDNEGNLIVPDYEIAYIG